MIRLNRTQHTSPKTMNIKARRLSTAIVVAQCPTT